MTGSLKTTAVGWVLLSLGHTAGAKDWQSNVKFRTLPQIAITCAKAGWYQGSGFFILNALINLAWARNPALLQDPVHKAMAALMVGIIWVSSGWYVKNGVMSNAAATALIGGLQSYSVLSM